MIHCFHCTVSITESTPGRASNSPILAAVLPGRRIYSFLFFLLPATAHCHCDGVHCLALLCACCAQACVCVCVCVHVHTAGSLQWSHSEPLLLCLWCIKQKSILPLFFFLLHTLILRCPPTHTHTTHTHTHTHTHTRMHTHINTQRISHRAIVPVVHLNLTPPNSDVFLWWRMAWGIFHRLIALTLLAALPPLLSLHQPP